LRANDLYLTRIVPRKAHDATTISAEQLEADFLDTTTGKFIELTTPRQVGAHLARPGYGGVTISTYALP
jgi:hypothetical protein